MNESPLYLDPQAPLEKRIDDLIGRIKLEDKVSQLCHESPAVDEVGIPAYNWWNECLHGVARAGKATVFPQAINMASTWNPRLIRDVADSISTEARAKYNLAVSRGSRERYQGLTFWTPNINIFRDPRWGRGQETWGEDPVLTAVMATAMVRGLQGEASEKKLKVAACAKHYAVHSGPEEFRHTFDAKVNDKDLWETYLPAFRALVDEGVESVMGAYNRTNGEPCCASPFLLEEVLRKRWGFEGHVVSDCWALKDLHLNHKVTDSEEESAAMALKAGCDLNCGCTYEALSVALDAGLICEEDIDRSLRRLLRCRFKLGMFDLETEWDHLGEEVIRCEKHVRLAENVATQSIVLLKNDGNTLPLANDRGHVLLQGPHVASVDVLLGNYSGVSGQLTTVLEGVSNHIEESLQFGFRKAFDMLHPNRNSKNWGIFESRDADTVILALGIDPNVEGEEGDANMSDYVGDRLNISLPDVQMDYVRKLAEEAPQARKVAIIFSGSPMEVTELHSLVDAILWVGYPGEQGGEAIAKVLFGKSRPGGRLPFSFPKSQSDLPPYEDYSMTNRTYRYMEKGPMYPFGFGLSYARFSYSELQTHNTEDSMRVSVRLTNESDFDDDEVVQVYIKDVPQAYSTPHQRLVAFRRVPLFGRQSTVVNFTLQREQLKMVNDEGDFVLPDISSRICVGGACPIKRSLDLGASPWVETTMEGLNHDL